MNSILKSIRMAIEIFAPAVLVTTVMLIYMMRPASGVKRTNRIKTEYAGRAAYCSLDAGPAINHQLRSHKN